MVDQVQVISKATQETFNVDEQDQDGMQRPEAVHRSVETINGPAVDIRNGLRDTTSGGLVIVGPAGSGRRAIFDAAFGLLESKPPLIHLSGSPYVAQMRHGVMSFVLSQLESGTFTTRHELVHGLSSLLCRNGERSVVTLGNPELIDPEPAAILAQLAAMKKIWLVAVCERLGELPADLLSMHRAGRLKRVGVRSMDVLHTRKFLESELGGPISMFAAAALWQLTRSNRDLLRPLLRELIAEGKLQLQSGTWVFAQGALRIGPTLRAQATRWTSGLGQRQQHVLDLLALGGPVAIGDLRRVGLEEHVASLQTRGLVSVGELPAAVVALRVPLFGHLLRQSMDEIRRPEIESLLVRIHHDPQAARTLTEVTALRELGNYEALIAVVEEYDQHGCSSSESWLLDSDQQLKILDQAIDALVMLGWHGRATARLATAQEGISAALLECPDMEKLLRARQSLRIMRARLALIEGRPTSVQGILSGAIPARVNADELSGLSDPAQLTTFWASEALHFRAMSVEAESWAMTSQQGAALAMVQRIRTGMEGLKTTGILEQVMSESDCTHIEMAEMRVLLLAGQWNDCADRARSVASGRYHDPRAIAFADAVLGVLGALAAETGSALGVLFPTQQQLALNSESSERAAVQAAVAYCLTEQGRGDEAAEMLLDAPPVLDRMLPLNFFTWASEVLSALALVSIGSPAAAKQRIRALLEKAEKTGDSGLVMQTLVVALRLGDHNVAPRLKRLADVHSGSGFRPYAHLARGILETDSVKLCEALEELSELGQTLHTGDACNLFIDSMAPKERRRVIGARSRSRQSEELSQQLNTPSVGKTADEPPWLRELTKREAQIALRVVSGLSNADIARQSGVSVRTVEGHLYQVYSKLHVRNRQELAGLDNVDRLPAVGR